MYGVCCRLEGTVDSIPQGLLDGRPASSVLLTHHQVCNLFSIEFCLLNTYDKINIILMFVNINFCTVSTITTYTSTTRTSCCRRVNINTSSSNYSKYFKYITIIIEVLFLYLTIIMINNY